MELDSKTSYFRIVISGSESSRPTVEELGLFLADFATLYELHRLNSDPFYGDFTFSRFALYRNGRPIDEYDKLYIESIRHESPIEAAVVLAAIVGFGAALKNFVESLEKIYNFRHNRKKLDLDIRNGELDLEKKQLEIEKLRLERLSKITSVDSFIVDSRSTVESRSATTWIRKVEARLERSSIRIENVEIDFFKREDDRTDPPSMREWVEQDESDDRS